MKKLSTLMDELHRQVKPGSRHERWYPLYEAVDSILYGSRATTRMAPHVRDGIDLKRTMSMVLVSLIPCALMAMWNTGYQANLALQALGAVPEGWRGSVMALFGCDPTSLVSNFLHGALYFLPVYIVTLVVGGLWESLFNIIRGHEFSEAFLVTSMLFTLTLPPDIPLWQVAVGISCGLVFAKEVFGGVGRNFMNPALAARAFIYFAYPAEITGDKVWTAVDGFTSATPLAVLAASDPGAGAAALDFSWWQLFIGTTPGSMGETSVLACILGAAMLLVTRIAPWRVMASMLAGAVLTSLFFLLLVEPVNALYTLPPHYHLVLGGFAFGMIFMATDPVSAAHTHLGQWFYGGLAGVLSIVIRVANPAYAEGTMLAILLANVFAPLIDYFVLQANIKRRMVRHG